MQPTLSTHINFTVACFLILWIIIVHAKIILDLAFCVVFGMHDVACIFIHQCADGGLGNSSSSPYTPPFCACHIISLTISLIIIHHNCHPSLCGWWCRKLFFSIHTTICMCRLISLSISLIHIHHNFHPIVMCSFILTKLSAPVSK